MLVNLIVRMTRNLRLHEATNKIEISRVIFLLCLKSESKDPRSSNMRGYRRFYLDYKQAHLCEFGNNFGRPRYLWNVATRPETQLTLTRGGRWSLAPVVFFLKGIDVNSSKRLSPTPSVSNLSLRPCRYASTVTRSSNQGTVDGFRREKLQRL